MKLQKIYTDVVKLYFRRGPEDEGHRLIYQCIEDGVGFSLSAYCAFWVPQEDFIFNPTATKANDRISHVLHQFKDFIPGKLGNEFIQRACQFQSVVSEDGTRKVFIQKKYAGWLDKADKIFVHERLKVIKVIDGRRMAIISGLRKKGE